MNDFLHEAKLNKYQGKRYALHIKKSHYQNRLIMVEPSFFEMLFSLVSHRQDQALVHADVVLFS